MMNMILKSYFSVLLSIGFASLSILLLGMYWIIKSHFRNSFQRDQVIQDGNVILPPSQDMAAIAGEDLITTQLDLARAYIETNKKQAAMKILEMIMAEGNSSQQEEARLLMGMI